MAVTAHWIEAETIQTAEGPVINLQLRADLIAFHNVPGRHTGEHLVNALLFILDRLKLTGCVSDKNNGCSRLLISLTSDWMDHCRQCV
jgi:hypothetical protein